MSALGRTDALYDAIGFEVCEVFFTALAEIPIFSASAAALNLLFSASNAMKLSESQMQH